MELLTEEDMLKLKKIDPWIEYYSNRLGDLVEDLRLFELMHMATSFGSPRTEGAMRYKSAYNEIDAIQREMVIYCLVKQYIPRQLVSVMFQGDPPSINN